MDAYEAIELYDFGPGKMIVKMEREKHADEALELYDFGPGKMIVKCPWNYESNLARKTVYFEGGGNLIRKVFVVRFSPDSSEVEESYVA